MVAAWAAAVLVVVAAVPPPAAALTVAVSGATCDRLGSAVGVWHVRSYRGDPGDSTTPGVSCVRGPDVFLP